MDFKITLMSIKIFTLASLQIEIVHNGHLLCMFEFRHIHCIVFILY